MDVKYPEIHFITFLLKICLVFNNTGFDMVFMNYWLNNRTFQLIFEDFTWISYSITGDLRRYLKIISWITCDFNEKLKFLKTPNSIPPPPKWILNLFISKFIYKNHIGSLKAKEV